MDAAVEPIELFFYFLSYLLSTHVSHLMGEKLQPKEKKTGG